MTTPDFLDRLSACRSRFDWSLTADSGRQADRRSHPRFHIRSKPAGRPSSSVTLDPLRAVCYAETGQMFGSDDWAEAARVLGLNHDDARDVLLASNDGTWTGSEGQRAPDTGLLGLRRKLLEAIGIIGPAQDRKREGALAVEG